MKTFKPVLAVLAALLVLVACQKEYSIDTGNTGAAASGTLKDSLGNCAPITINGTYKVDSTLKDSNYIVVLVNITSPGVYKISTDTSNGFSFKDSGYIGSTGAQSIKLKGSGKPILPNTTNFTVSFGTSSFCLITIPVSGTVGGGGGTTAAVYTLPPGSCSAANVQGTYTTGTPLNSINQVALQVNVTTAGNYAISTGSVNGMTFIGGGTFTSTGLQNVILRGGGTPTTAGNNSIPITAGSTSCSFVVTVAQGSGTGTGSVNQSDTAWKFTVGSITYKGSFDFVGDTVIGGAKILYMEGPKFSSPDTAILLGVLFSGGSIQPGTYNTKTFATFDFADYKDTANPVTIYTADNTTPKVGVDITIISYDPVTKIVIGTFSGTVTDKAGTGIINLTAGKFKAQLQ